MKSSLKLKSKQGRRARLLQLIFSVHCKLQTLTESGKKRPLTLDSGLWLIWSTTGDDQDTDRTGFSGAHSALKQNTSSNAPLYSHNTCHKQRLCKIITTLSLVKFHSADILLL